MCPFKCCLCCSPSTEFPQDFKSVLSEFIRIFNKFLSCNGVTDLILCQSCWIYLMRVHKFDRQLMLKRENCDAKISLLSSKIRSRRSSLESEKNVSRPENYNFQALAEENHEEEDVKVSGCSQHGNSGGPSEFSVKIIDDSNTESLEYSHNVGVSTAGSAPVYVKLAEPKPIKAQSADKSDCEPQQVDPYPLAVTYENNWLPKKCTIPPSSKVVKRLSETEFIYMSKYHFHATPTGFKCGLCPAIRVFQPGRGLWSCITRHITDWHKGDERRRESKVLQKFIEVAPNLFHYGKYTVEKTEGGYRCGECGVVKPPGTRSKARHKHIINHINTEHESNPLKTYVCEYCGKVYTRQDYLKEHMAVKHENPNAEFPCNDCGKLFSSPSGVKMHRNNSHVNRHRFICECCGRKFSQKVALEIHVASIHKKEKIKCEECGKMFGSRTAMYLHRYSHTGKKYTCEICGMDFTQPYSVIRHKKTAHPQ